MPSNYTEHYQLNLWDAGDQVQRVDFNADNAKVDAAIHAVAQKADSLSSGKAEQSALTAEVSTRISQVNALNAKVAKLGNCKIYHTSYVGNGEDTRTFTFPGRPLFVIAMSNTLLCRAAQGLAKSLCWPYHVSADAYTTTWSGNSLIWSGPGFSDYSPNAKDMTFQMIVFMDAAE